MIGVGAVGVVVGVRDAHIIAVVPGVAHSAHIVAARCTMHTRVDVTTTHVVVVDAATCIGRVGVVGACGRGSTCGAWRTFALACGAAL